jgi:hypothetical protein
VLESVTVRENVEVPAAVGVPETFQLVPEPLIDSHEGSDEPVVTAQVYGAVPPEACRGSL